MAPRLRHHAPHTEDRTEPTTRYQVQRAFLDAGEQLLAAREPGPTRRLSLDEAAHRRGRELATVISDLDRRRVIEVLDGRSQRIVARWLHGLPEPERQAIRIVSIDPYEGYRAAIRAELPHATIVVDHFHLVRGANSALDTVRRQRQRQARAARPRGTRQAGKAGRWRPELYHARHRLLKASERLSFHERRQLCELFTAEPLIAEAWGLKEAFRHIYKAPTRAEAERRLDRFYLAVAHANLPAFNSFADGLRLWREELLAYFEEPTSNGYAEGVINKVKVIKRRAYGLPTFTGFRKRVLIVCG
jgi:transposase